MGSSVKTYPTWIQKIKICRKPPKSTTIHSISNSRSNRNCIVCMKWCKRLLFLTCCLRLLTHSGNENLYQSYLYLGGANMNHQTIYSGKCHYYGSSIQESSSQKAGSSKSWQACGHDWTCSNFPWQLRCEESIPMHQSRSNITGPSTLGFSSKTDELTLYNLLLQCYWSPS